MSSAGSNSAIFVGATSYPGTVYYVILASGTPTAWITPSQIYSKNLPSSIAYGNASSARIATGVNIVANFVVKSLSTQSSYIIGAYLNSTVGISIITYRNFSTTQASNGASIKLAMKNMLDTTVFLSYLSDVWRIKVGRIGVLTIQESLTTLQTTFTSAVMNSRIYVYEVVVAPDVEDDSVKPIDLLNTHTKDSTQRAMLLSFVPDYITFYTESTREIIPAKPKSRLPLVAISVSHDTVVVMVSMW